MPDSIIYGTNGNDTLSGGNGKDTIYGLGGDDTLYGGNGVDRLFGGDGNDQLFGDNGSDDLIGGAGDDLIDGLNGFDTAYYSGAIGEYSFYSAAGYLHVVHLGGAGADGHDRLIRVERLVFADRTIDVGSGSNAPVAGDDHVSITEDAGTYSSGAASVKDNDFDFDGDTLTVTGGTFTGTYGTLTLNANGTYSYTLNASAQTLAQGQNVTDSFNYTVTDNDGSDTGALVFHIAGVNDAPVAHADTASTSENATILVNVLANDTDIDNGAVLTVTTASAPSGQGTASVVGNQVQFNPGTDFDHLAQGATASVTVNYSIQDQFGATSSSTISVTVTGTNDGPVAHADTASTSENAGILVNVLANDTDVDDGAVLTLVAASAPSGQGSASVVSNQVQFNPGTDFDDLAVGQTEAVVVSYSIQDQFGASSTSTLTITVTGTNDGPVANPDTASTSENATVTVDVLANDTDVDNGAVLTVTTASAPSGQGTASVVGNQVQFNPGSDFDDLAVGQSEVVVVNYSMQDQFGAASSSTLTITVTGTNDGPVANPDTATTSENATITVDVLANDTDVDSGAVLTVTAASAPSGQGTASVVGNQVQFNPGSDFDDLAVGQSEVVVVSYSIQDEHGAPASSTLSITVTGTNDGPVANPDTGTTSENVTLLVDVLANDTDVDNGAVLTVTTASAPSGEGTASVVGNQVQFNPGTDFDYLAVGESANVVVSYSMQDEHGASSSSSLTITVTGTNDAPTINAGGTDATGSATELPNNDPNENAFTHTDSGAVAFADVDTSDTHSASFAPQAGGYLGTFTLDPVDQMGDNVAWHFSVADSDLDSLNDGETLTQTYSVQIDDGHGGTVAQDVTITLTGAADGPQTEWYIDNSAVGSANVGTQADPFTSIAAFNAAQGTVGGPQVAATVYLLAGTGTYAETDGLNLLDDQIVTGVAAGPLRPTIVTTGGDGINVAHNNTISGLDVGNTSGADIADSGTSVGTLTITDVGTSGTGQVIDVDQGGTLNVTINNAVSTGSSGGAIDLNGVSGSFTVTGATTITGVQAGGGVDITGSSLAANFAGGGTIATGSTTGVNFVGNSGSLALGGGLDIVTTTATGLNASGGGSVTATGAGNSIASTSGTALSVTMTTIGAAGLTLESVSSSGAASGIVLNSTGAGAFSVTGTGAAGSGGAILASTGAGISLTNTGPVSLTDMTVSNGGDDGIRGTTVNGLHLDGVTVAANGNAAGEHGVDLTGLTGISGVTDSSFTGSAEDNFHLVNSSGTLDLTVTGSTFGNSLGAFANDGLSIQANGTSLVRASVTDSIFTNNRGDHFQLSTDTAATSTSHITFSENTLTSTSAAVLGGGITLSPAGGADLFFAVEDNDIQGAFSTAINATTVAATAASDVHGTITGNTIGTTGVANSGSASGNGINVNEVGNGTMTVQIDDNTIHQWNQFGVFVLDSGGAGRINATIDDNVINDPGALATQSMRVQAGAASADTGQIYLEMNDNVMDVAAISADARLWTRFGGDILMPGYSGAANNTAAVDAFITAANPLGGDIQVVFNATAGSGYFDTPGSLPVPLPTQPDAPFT